MPIPHTVSLMPKRSAALHQLEPVDGGLRTKNWMWIVGVAAVASALGAQNAQKPKGVFSMLEVGQAVSLKDHGATVSLSFFEDEVPLAHTVVEVGEDFVVLRDVVGVKETVGPVYSLKAIEKVE